MNLPHIDPSMTGPLIPTLVLIAALIVWALVDIVRNPVQHLPKWAWALVVLLFIPLGAVIYLMAGRGRAHRLSDEDLR